MCGAGTQRPQNGAQKHPFRQGAIAYIEPSATATIILVAVHISVRGVLRVCSKRNSAVCAIKGGSRVRGA